MTEARPEATVIVKGNCGIPEFRGSEIHYSGTPELMSDYVRLAVDAGARIVGGCCGTSFAHLAAMRKALDSHTKAERPTVETIVARIFADLRAFRIYDGPSEVHRYSIARHILRGRRGHEPDQH